MKRHILKFLERVFGEEFVSRWRGLEAIFPTALAGFFIISLTFVLYSGNRRDQLSTNIEGLLIRRSLKGAVQPPKYPEKTAVISESEEDLRNLPNAPPRTLKGLDIKVYADLLDKIAAAHPAVIFFSWVPGAQGVDPRYLAPMIAAFKRVPRDIKVFLPYPIYELEFLPAEMREAVHVLEGDDCRYDVQSYCTYDKEFSDWVIQKIADLFWGVPTNPIDANRISLNLPHFRPMYLLNLADIHKLRNFNFSQILDPKFDVSALRGSALFVGSSVVQPRSANGDNDLLRRIFIAQNDYSKSFESAATPYHITWAALAQMFIDHRTVAVPPHGITAIFTIALCLCILFLILRISATAALGLFLVFAFAYPFINQLAIRYWQIYFPMFDALYVGLSTLLLAAFSKLSYQLYLKWRLEEKSKALAQTADLKGNFISLISHNLNTPIAKMQGLIEVLQSQIKSGTGAADIQMIARLVAQLQLAVKAVLIATAVDEGALNPQTLPLSTLSEEMVNLMGPTLQKLGVRFEITNEAEAVPLRMDKRALLQAIASLLLLFKNKDQLCLFSIKTRISDEEDFTIEVSAQSSTLPEATSKLLLARELTSVRQLSELEFLDDVHINLVKSMLLAYHGQVNAATASALSLSLQPSL